MNTPRALRGASPATEGRRAAIRTTFVVASALLAAACAADEPVPEDDAPPPATEQQLAYFSALTAVDCSAQPNGAPALWDLGDTVELCFTGPDAGNATLVDGIRDAVNDIWGRAVNLTLHWNGTCPATIDPDWVSIFAVPGGTGGIAMPGRRNRLRSTNTATCNANEWGGRSDVQIVVRGDPAVLRWSVAHEFGHVLGFLHEHDRGDNLAVERGAATSCPSENAAATANSWFTVYDKLSVMNYCGHPYGRLPGDGNLTALDQLGAEILYPPSLGSRKSACVDRCFNTGNGVIVRSTGSFTNDWKARGAKGLAMPQWWMSTPGTWTSEELSATSLPNGTNTFGFSFTDVRGRSNSGTAQVTKSDSAHTAVLAAAIL